MAEMKKAAAGWYPDPRMVGTQRYWDGAKWTDNVAPLPPAAEKDWTRQRTLGTVLGLAVIVLLFLAYVVRIWG